MMSNITLTVPVKSLTLSLARILKRTKQMRIKNTLGEKYGYHVNNLGGGEFGFSL